MFMPGGGDCDGGSGLTTRSGVLCRLGDLPGGLL